MNPDEQNREIKFRAWDKQFKRMISWENLADFSPVTFEQMLRNHYERFIVMQYSGKIDKFGVDIYEGDIVAWENGDSLAVGAEPSISKDIVKWDNKHQGFLPFFNPETKVIGNVFETVNYCDTPNCDLPGHCRGLSSHK